MPNSQLNQIEALFTRLGSMTWESFVKNRLPLLNLPADVLTAVSTGALQYTKAVAISRIRDDQARATALDKAIAENWSLTQIRDYIKSITPPPQSVPLKQQLDAAYQKAKKAKVWEDPSRQARLSAILMQLEALLKD